MNDQTTSRPGLARWWGKANCLESIEPDHPLVFHSLDVAACTHRYLDTHPQLLLQFSAWFGLTEVQARGVLIFLMAVHDMGKFAENFQFKCPEVAALRFGGLLKPSNSTAHHDRISACFLSWAFAGKRLPVRMRAWTEEAWRIVLTASFGHHGTPPKSNGHDVAELKGAMFDESREAALAFFDWCASKFLPDDLPDVDELRLQLSSWWIAGLAVLADWIGSNTHWFPYATHDERDLTLDQYWDSVALPRASVAIEAAGVNVEPPKRYSSPEALLSHLRGRPLRPAQHLAHAIAIGVEPQLFFLEDATGSGKTEAALILAARLMDSGLGDGLFFGLPTQATADQMWDRMDSQLPAWFDFPERATMVLTHGARDQVHAFAARRDSASDGLRGEQDTASLQVTQWLAQSNKRALLAQMGVGTLDQVLMGALRIKHQSLRMLGLFRKILIVDEVHSYDSYMSAALCATLAAHAAAGGCAILLSATMSLALRTQLLQAYASGIEIYTSGQAQSLARRSSAALSAESLGYPLLTQWSASLGLAPREVGFPASPHSHRTLAIEYLSDWEGLIARLGAWHAANQVSVWVRNTVADATLAYECLCQRFGVENIVLFHSRFAAVDRRRIQDQVLDILGKAKGGIGKSANRRNQIIITTQVFQESLDCCADQMISDLAFVDILLQRLGRYRRHLRDATGRLLNPDERQADGRGESKVVIYGPTREGDPKANWYSAHSRGAAMVYAAYGKLWLSARAIGEQITLPAQFRTLVEAVYGNVAEAIPEALQTAEDKETGKEMAARIAAEMNAISLVDGYCGDGWDADERIGTRLGDSVEATMVRVENGHLIPWARGSCTDADDEWALSAIRVPGWWFADANRMELRCLETALAQGVENLKAERRFLKYRLVLPFTRHESGEWRSMIQAKEVLTLRYCAATGLRKAAKP